MAILESRGGIVVRFPCFLAARAAVVIMVMEAMEAMEAMKVMEAVGAAMLVMHSPPLPALGRLSNSP